MGRTPIWTHIAEELARDIAAGHYGPGARLPTEAALATRFGVNRHTVRRAIADLVARDMVFTRRGAGAFVTQAMTEYPIGRRVRFHTNISATGRLPEKSALRVETRGASAVEAEALGTREHAPVVLYDGLSRSGGVVLAHFSSVFPLERLPGMVETLAEVTSVTKALAANGVPDFLRAETRVTAEVAGPVLARHLGVGDGDPVLRTHAINTGPDGVPVEYGITSFAGARVALTFAPE